MQGEYRLFIPALIGWGAVAVMLPNPGLAKSVVLILAIMVCIAAVVVVVPRTRRTIAAAVTLGAMPVVVVLALAVSVSVAEGKREAPELHRLAKEQVTVEEQVKLAGYPAQTESQYGDRTWVPAVLERNGVTVLLWLEGPPDDRWAPGHRLIVTGRLTLLEATSSARVGMRVDHAMYREAQPVSFHTVASALRASLRDVAQEVTGAELVPGLAIGDTSLVSNELDEAMRVSSLTHLTAVSGANCALIINVMTWFSRRLGAPRRLRIVLSAGALTAFVIIVGPDPSVQRASVMATVMLVSDFGGKRALGLASLGAATILLLVLDPWQAYHPGFGLSVAATAGILLFAGRLTKVLRKVTKIPSFLAMPVAVAIAAQFSCSALLILLEPGIPAVGVLANVIAAPAAPVGTGVGLLAALLAPVTPQGATTLVWVAGLAARWIEATATITSELPFATLHWVSGTAGAILMAAVQVTGLIGWGVLRGSVTLRGRSGQPRSGRMPWQTVTEATRARSIGPKTLGAVLLSSSVVVALITIVVPPTISSLRTPADWAIVGCDVGQGDAILVRDPAEPRRVMLVDTGDDEQKLSACLDRFGVSDISLLVLTHDDRDHVGALPVVLDRTMEALVAPEIVGEGPRQVIEQLETANIPHRSGTEGIMGNLGGMEWVVLSPEAHAFHSDRNASSIVLWVETRGLGALLLADIGEEEQRRLMEIGIDRPIHLVKVAHHGSKDQLAEFYSDIAAPYALLSSGEDNGYGHPAKQTLQLLTDANSHSLRTDKHGSIAFSVRDNAVHVWSER